MIKINRKILSIYKTNRGKPDESGLCNGNIDMSICRQILITRINKSFKLIITPGEERIRQLNLYHIKKNLFNGEYEKGYIKGTDINLHGTSSNKYRTTGWFPVNASQGRSLVLSGTAHNRSAWQFMRADRTILAAGEAKRKYNIVKDVLQDKTVSKVDIPSDAVYARVFYASYDDGAELDDRLQIEYGKLPTYYQPYHSEGFELPDLGKDESIEYRNGVWTLVSKKGKRVLDMQELTLEVGDTIILDSNTCEINIYVTNETDITNMSIKGITNRTNEPNEINKTNKTNESNEANEPNEINKSNEPNEINKTHMGIYGVRWDMNSRYPVCERIQDAKGFTFNCIYGSNYMTPYENSFDSVYPWSDIRLCNIRFSKKGKMRIIYSDEEEFHTECSKGNIFVEIPKFYCKREQIDGYEYLLISGTEQEGFIIDPSFETANGIIDHIYIGAYLSSFRKKKLRSVSNSFPLIRKSLQSIRNLALNSYGIAEVDLLAILTVQKLYIVETAILDSQSIFTGLVHLPYLLKDRQTPLYSLTNESSTNRIRVKESVTTRRFCVGDAVSILQNWKEYRNKPLICQREITDIKSDGKTLEITFSGEPVDIIKRQSGITCIPYKNGSTDNIKYVTGMAGSISGHTPFKYRGIENLWGNVSVLLDNAYVRDSELYIKYPTGQIVKIGYKLPVQKVMLSPDRFGDPENMIVRRMGYDENNPLIMLPCETGNGASTSGYYCDAWYNSAEEGVMYILTYGGAWDNKGYAGIFNFRASFTEDRKVPYNGSRIMLNREYC